MMFQWDAVDSSPELGGQSVLKIFELAVRYNRQTARAELQSFLSPDSFSLMFNNIFLAPIAHPPVSATAVNWADADLFVAVLSCTQYCDSDPACTELLGHVPESRDVDVDQPEAAEHPCIVVEGLDAAGQYAEVLNISCHANFYARLESPPLEVAPTTLTTFLLAVISNIYLRLWPPTLT